MKSTMSYRITDAKDGFQVRATTPSEALVAVINHCVAEGLRVVHTQEDYDTTTFFYVDPDDDKLRAIVVRESW